MLKKYDNIIIGSGIAGTTLLLKLLKHYPNEKSLIISNSELSNCSAIAAGMANPLAFKRLGIIPGGEILMSSSREFYKYVESQFNIELLHQTPTLKLITSVKELNDISIHLENNQSENINSIIEKNSNPSINAQDILKVNSTYWLNTELYINFLKDVRHLNFDRIETTFSASSLNQIDNQYNYSSNNVNVVATRIFFCEGHLIAQNPFFNWIPMKPAKGETLIIESSTLQSDDIINKDAYLVPLSQEHYKLGATYKWENINDTIEESSKIELIEKLNKMINCDYKVVDQKAGVRPSSKDRKPIIGMHPFHKNMYVLNALGTRGVMLAPYYAEMLLKSIFKGDSIAMDVNISRFKKELALLVSNSNQ